MSSISGIRADASSEARWTHTQVEALPFSMALLESHGRIVAVNDAWRRFGDENGADASTIEGAGLNYLDVCERCDDPTSRAVAEGLREVLRGTRALFELEYAAHAPNRLSWFRLRASRASDARHVVVTHFDITETWMARARLKIQTSAAKAFSARLTMLAAGRELGLAIAAELGGDFVGVWTLDSAAWSMRCVDTWMRSAAIAPFARASRAASLGPGTGLPGRAWKLAKVQWATKRDVEPAPGLGRRFTIMSPAALAAGFGTALAIPLKVGDDVLAVIEVVSRIECEPDPWLIELLEIAGEQLALWELRERAEQCARVAVQEADDARAQLESVLSCAPGFVIVVDRADHIQFINRTPPSIRKGEIIGLNWRDCIPAETHEQIEAALRAVFATGETQTYELSVPWPGGRPTWLTTQVGPMRAAAGIAGAVVIAQDVTDVKRAQAELAEAQRLATVGTLAAGVAHEINTPVQFVNDSVHFLRDASGDLLSLLDKLLALHSAVRAGASAPELEDLAEAASQALEQSDLAYLQEHVPKAFERSIDGVERVAAIVRSMKEFSHPATKEKAAADLNRAILATLTVAGNEYKYVAQVETDLAEHLPLVYCHINELNQAVLNIVVNAAHAIGDVMKATGQQGVIRVVTRRDGDQVVVAISDTGGGIPEAIRPRVFDPFFTTKEVGRGTGQGLAIARTSIREKHGGDLSFETKLGEGTTFYIRLPIGTPDTG